MNHVKQYFNNVTPQLVKGENFLLQEEMFSSKLSCWKSKSEWKKKAVQDNKCWGHITLWLDLVTVCFGKSSAAEDTGVSRVSIVQPYSIQEGSLQLTQWNLLDFIFMLTVKNLGCILRIWPSPLLDGSIVWNLAKSCTETCECLQEFRDFWLYRMIGCYLHHPGRKPVNKIF